MFTRPHPPNHRTIRNFQSIDKSVGVAEENRAAFFSHRNGGLHRSRSLKAPPQAPGSGIQRIDRPIFAAHKQFSSVRSRLAKCGRRSRKSKRPFEFQILDLLAIQSRGHRRLKAAVARVASPPRPAWRIRRRVQIPRAHSRHHRGRCGVRLSQILSDGSLLRLGKKFPLPTHPAGVERSQYRGSRHLAQSFRLRSAHVIIGLVTARALLREQRRPIRHRRNLLPRTSLQSNRRPKPKQQGKPQSRCGVTSRLKTPGNAHFLQSLAHLFRRSLE